MSEPARRIATYEDILSAPDHMVAEILNGELHLSPRPASTHGWSELGLAGDLRGHFGLRGGDGPGGWWFQVEPELHLGSPKPASVVAVPDVAGWRRERMPAMQRVPAFTLPPDWLCEVVSPGPAATRRDRVLKPDLYASRGIPHMWILDPIGQTLEVFRLQAGVYARVQAFAGDVRVRAEPFDAVELDMSEWWVPEDPPG